MLRRYGLSLAVVSFSIILTTNLPSPSDASSLFVILGGIVFGAWYGGLGPGLFTILVAIIGIDHYLMDPRFSLALDSNDNLLRLILFAVTSLVIVLFVSSRQVAQARLARSNEELNALASRMETVREEERARLAREIHDQIGGSLSILKLDVASVHKQIKQDTTLQHKTNDILKEIDGAILTVQQIAMELRPPLLDHGLADALESYLDTNCRRVELDCEKSLDGKVPIEGALATAMFRIFQEAFTNIIRHAKATKIMVSLKQDPRGITLAVIDNGVGIEQAKMLQPDALGLAGMRERIRPFGGTVTLAGRPGEGTTVTIVVPISSGSLLE